MRLPTTSGESFAVRVRTGADQTAITGWDEHREAFEMSVAARPQKGKANEEILGFFKKKFGLDVEIRSGHTSRSKLLRIR